MLHNGLYEQIINKGLDAELAQTDKLSKTEPIDEAEAAKVLAKYVTEIPAHNTSKGAIVLGSMALTAPRISFSSV